MPAIARLSVGWEDDGAAGARNGAAVAQADAGTLYVKNRYMKKAAIAAALCGSLICSQAQAKTFVGVLWPMFGPLPAIGLVELVAELKKMPDVEVETYVHQAWPSLVADIDRQPPGTHTVVVGYSLGANSSVFVANNAKYVDLIVALQPSMLSWNPPLAPGKVGRMIEIYNPNPWMTFGGMGSKKLVGDNIEYIANNDSHPGAQFNSEFRHLVKSEIAKFTTEDRLETAQAAMPAPLDPVLPDRTTPPQSAGDRPTDRPREMAARPQIAQNVTPNLPKPPRRAAPERQAQAPKPAALQRLAQEPKAGPPRHQPKQRMAFLDTLSGSVDSGDLSTAPELTVADMMDYARRTYGVSHRRDDFNAPQPPAPNNDIIAASFSRNGSL
jgi:hypothetical protein